MNSDLYSSSWRMNTPRSYMPTWEDTQWQRTNTANLLASNLLFDVTQFKAFYVKTITAILRTECKMHMSLRYPQLWGRAVGGSLMSTQHPEGFRGCIFVLLHHWGTVEEKFKHICHREATIIVQIGFYISHFVKSLKDTRKISVLSR